MAGRCFNHECLMTRQEPAWLGLVWPEEFLHMVATERWVSHYDPEPQITSPKDENPVPNSFPSAWQWLLREAQWVGPLPSVLVLERSFPSSSLWQADVRVKSSLLVWTLPSRISRATSYHKDPQREISPLPYLERNNIILQVDHFKGAEMGKVIHFSVSHDQDEKGELSPHCWNGRGAKLKAIGVVRMLPRDGEMQPRRSDAPLAWKLWYLGTYVLRECSHTLTQFPVGLGYRMVIYRPFVRSLTCQWG